MKLVTKNPNFSIVVPTGCNARCGFCFWNKNNDKITVDKEEYLNNLEYILNRLPKQFQQCSITGGEPTYLSWLVDILRLARKRFPKVVMSSNGFKIKESHLELIDHLNISRHDPDDIKNRQIFNSNTVPSLYQLELINSQAHKHNVDVTLNSVVTNETPFIFYNKMVKITRQVNADHMCFRKIHSDLKPLEVERAMSKYPILNVSECPVCKTKIRKIDGMETVWKYSVEEPSNDMNGIYELIFHPNMNLTTDWKGDNIMNGEIKKDELKEMIREIIKEELSNIIEDKTPKNMIWSTGQEPLSTDHSDGCLVRIHSRC